MKLVELRSTSPEAEIAEHAAMAFVEHLDRLIGQGLTLEDARRVALIVALASIEDEPDGERWIPLIEDALARRARGRSSRLAS